MRLELTKQTQWGRDRLTEIDADGMQSAPVEVFILCMRTHNYITSKRSDHVLRMASYYNYNIFVNKYLLM